MALMDAAINTAHNGTARVADSNDLRSRLQNQPQPGPGPAVDPAECGVFRPHSAPTSSADLGMHFAAGVLTLTGEWSREALAFVLVRSAPRSDVQAADFSYTDEQARRCARFRRTAGSGPASTVRLLPLAAVGEKAYATVTVPAAAAGTPPPPATLALQVFKGSLTIGLSRQAPGASSDVELRAALEPLLRIGKRMVGQPAESPSPTAPPAVPAPAPAPLPQETPQHLARLLQHITGPHGDEARVLAGRYAPAGPEPGPPSPPCTYDDVKYLGTLHGAPLVVAEIPAALPTSEHISLRLVRFARGPSAAMPFDRRAAGLAGCKAIEQKVPGVPSRTWTAVRRLAVDTSGETGYALSYGVSGGSPVRHILVAARKGTLSVEAETEARSEATALQAARGLAATINKVMARVGT